MHDLTADFVWFCNKIIKYLTLSFISFLPTVLWIRTEKLFSGSRHVKLTMTFLLGLISNEETQAVSASDFSTTHTLHLSRGEDVDRVTVENSSVWNETLWNSKRKKTTKKNKFIDTVMQFSGTFFQTILQQTQQLISFNIFFNKTFWQIFHKKTTTFQRPKTNKKRFCSLY